MATGDLLSKKFDEYSRSQWWAGIAANIVGLAALALGGIQILHTLKGIGPTDEVSWQFTALKLGVTFTIVAGAVVAFRLGTHFLSESRNSKKVALELHAIGPFLAQVDDANAVRDAKTAFIERTFGPTLHPSSNGEELLPASAVEKILEGASRLIGRQA